MQRPALCLALFFGLLVLAVHASREQQEKQLSSLKDELQQKDQTSPFEITTVVEPKKDKETKTIAEPRKDKETKTVVEPRKDTKTHDETNEESKSEENAQGEESEEKHGTKRQPVNAKKKVEISKTDNKPIIKLPSECRYYRTLLALDGGGLRGMLSTQVLKTLVNSIKDYYLTNQTTLALVDPKSRLVTKNDFHIDLADYFDAIAGISAGSWIATYLAAKGGYKKQSQQIFDLEHIRRRFGTVRPGSVEGLDVYFLEYGVYIYPSEVIPVRPKIRILGVPDLKIKYISAPLHSPRGLEWTLDKFLGDTHLGQVQSSLLVVAFDLNMRSTVQFVYDKLEDLETRVTLREIAKRRLNLDECTKKVKDLKPQMERGKTPSQQLKTIKSECDILTELPDLPGLAKHETTEEEGEGEEEKEEEETKEEEEEGEEGEAKGTVRTGYVWTRTIPRNLENDKEFDEPGVKYYVGMDYLLKDITRASSAFPGLHPAKNVKAFYDVRHEYDLIDGAMVGNNPMLHALVWMASNPNVNLTDIAAISIGTGSTLDDLTKLGDAGRLQWLPAMIGLILDSSTEFIQSNIDYLYYVTMRNLILPNQYIRVQAVAEVGTEKATALRLVDLVTMLPELKKIGEETAIKYKANIDKFVRDFIFAKCSRGVYRLVEEARQQVQIGYFDTSVDKYKKARDAAEDRFPGMVPLP